MEVKTRYGSYTIGTPEHRGRGWYVREDMYHSANPIFDGGKDRVTCLGKTDLSPIYHGHYDSQCGYCWLHHGHTEAVHQHALEQKQQQR